MILYSSLEWLNQCSIHYSVIFLQRRLEGINCTFRDVNFYFHSSTFPIRAINCGRRHESSPPLFWSIIIIFLFLWPVVASWSPIYTLNVGEAEGLMAEVLSSFRRHFFFEVVPTHRPHHFFFTSSKWRPNRMLNRAESSLSLFFSFFSSVRWVALEFMTVATSVNTKLCFHDLAAQKKHVKSYWQKGIFTDGWIVKRGKKAEGKEK